MKQNAVKSIFEHFLSDHSIDINLANHSYQILQAVNELILSVIIIYFCFFYRFMNKIVHIYHQLNQFIDH